MLHLIADSSCDLLAGELDSPHARLTVIPMHLRLGEAEYPDTPELSVPHLLQQMRRSSTASTACPAPADFIRAFEAEDENICITISSSLSGTYGAALAARDIVLAQHPDKKIFVMDSRATSGSMVLLLRRAAALAAQGLAFDALCQELRTYHNGLRLCFTLEHFDNLVKNGRMPAIAGALLQTLGIRIIAEATEAGTIHVAKKVRGIQQTLRSIIQIMGAAKDCTKSHVVISHCQNPETAQRLEQLLRQELAPAAVEVRPCRGLTSFYAMERGLIVSY